MTLEERSLEYAKGLSKLVQVETISEYNHVNLEKMNRFLALLKETFPVVFQRCELEEFNGSILLKWQGKFSELDPILFMNHYDVVEAAGEWEHDPFGGEIIDGVLWGRGTLDTKGGLFCMLQAAEELLKEGYEPARTIYFESACTEEVEGSGCNTISKELQDRGIHFYMVLDEGGMIMHDPIGGADGDFAMVGVGEKGCADLKFIAKSHGGHASMPGKDSPLVRLGKFMVAVDNENLFKVEMNDVVKELLRRIGPSMGGIVGGVVGNPDFFSLLLEKVMPSVSAAAGAMLQTTLAFTMAQGSDAYNAMPAEAFVTGNMRFAHHQGFEESVAAVKKIADKYDIEIEVIDPGFQSSISSFRCEQFRLIEKAVDTVYPGIVCAPYVTNTASDARYMDRVSEHIYRLVPFFISDQQLDSIHGINENVDVKCLAPAVDFYRYIMLGI